mmetsp:Transcript_65268/g.183762  ORF Transcript_65268/g.183762 Transcript_65268/m.183762 type:complete len:81 (+) Transcript_65268:100-342(+)
MHDCKSLQLPLNLASGNGCPAAQVALKFSVSFCSHLGGPPPLEAGREVVDDGAGAAESGYLSTRCWMIFCCDSSCVLTLW